jgi:hypothetical protein
MRVFISWSGELSRNLGEGIRDWLPSVLQFVKPYFTPNDIDKGAKWASEISQALSVSSICIIVLTRDNLASSWIMFEAGAISSTLDNSRVCPIVFDLEPTDLQGPLAQFQVTRFLEDDFRKLFNTINAQAGDNKLSDGIAQGVFDKWWPDLNQRLTRILHGHTANSNVKKIRSDRDLLEEVLLLVRNQTVEKESARLTQKYDGSLTAQLVDVIRWVIDEDYIVERQDLHDHLLGIQSFVNKRLSESDVRTSLLKHLDELLKVTRMSPGALSSTRRAGVNSEEDDIPL